MIVLYGSITPFVPADAGTQFLLQGLGPRIRARAHIFRASSPAKAGDPVIARPSLLDAPLSRGMTGRFCSCGIEIYACPGASAGDERSLMSRFNINRSCYSSVSRERRGEGPG